MKCPFCGAETRSNICEYCGSEIPQKDDQNKEMEDHIADVDEQSFCTCPRCGNSKITFEREQVGTATQAQFRPKYVGVGHKGQQVSTSAYRTVGLCRTCGYTWCLDNKEAEEFETYKKPRKTWLWVLGWIFIFPVPVMILINRKKNIKPAIRYAIIAAAWLLYAAWLISSGGGSTDTANKTDSSASESSTQAVIEDDKTTAGNETVYAEDEVVNRFITEFNENSNLEITNISKGNIRTKYFGYANERYLEMLNANDADAKCFKLTINGGQEESDEKAMMEVFQEAVKILDPSITEETINAVVEKLNNGEYTDEDCVISDTVTVDSYVPIVELSNGKTSCRIDISASDYK